MGMVIVSGICTLMNSRTQELSFDQPPVVKTIDYDARVNADLDFAADKMRRLTGTHIRPRLKEASSLTRRFHRVGISGSLSQHTNFIV